MGDKLFASPFIGCEYIAGGNEDAFDDSEKRLTAPVGVRLWVAGLVL